MMMEHMRESRGDFKGVLQRVLFSKFDSKEMFELNVREEGDACPPVGVCKPIS